MSEFRRRHITSTDSSRTAVVSSCRQHGRRGNAADAFAVVCCDLLSLSDAIFTREKRMCAEIRMKPALLPTILSYICSLKHVTIFASRVSPPQNVRRWGDLNVSRECFLSSGTYRYASTAKYNAIMNECMHPNPCPTPGRRKKDCTRSVKKKSGPAKGTKYAARRTRC